MRSRSIVWFLFLAASLTLALLAASCGTEASISPAASGSGDTSEDSGTQGVETEGGSGQGNLDDGLVFGLQLPPDFSQPDPPGESAPPAQPGPQIDPARFDGSVYVYCDDLDLNPRDDAPIEAGVKVLVGDIFTTGEGAGWILEFSAEKFSPGQTVEFPSESWEFVLFMIDAHDLAGVPREYNSDQDESFGSLTLGEVPCQGNGDVLTFTIDAGIGAETNPGYTTWADVTGSFVGTAGEAPPG